MKKLTFLQILFCFSLLTGLALFLTPAYGEEPENNTDPEEGRIYEPLFGNEQTSYTVWRETYDYGMTDSLTYIKDTIIDVSEYKAFQSVLYSEPYCLRVNLQNSKVYSLNPIGNEEHLVFDLTLNEGDIFELPFDGQKIEYLVDSVYTDINGRKNIRMINEYSRPLKYLKFIEGAGSSVGFFPDNRSALFLFQLCGEKDRQKSYYYYEDYYNEYLKCQKELDCYMPENFFIEPQCFFSGFSPIKKINKNLNFLLYPNPCREYIMIESIDKTITESYHIIQLSDLQGHIFLQQKIEEFPIQLSTGYLQSGNYIIRIFSNQKEIFSNPLIVKE